MAGDILSTGISGLLANQRALQTVANNVSNVNTEGYSRQNISFTARAPVFLGGGYFGTGVDTQSVERVYDDFLTQQMRGSTSSYGQAESFASYASAVDGLLADPQVGVMPALQGFFGALNDVANDPSSIPARQTMVTQAEMLADRFNTVNGRLDGIRAQVNSRIGDEVAEINSLTENIANINRSIVMSPGGSPNSLLDQRDRLVGQLAEKVSITVVTQDDGAANIFVGNGQALVVGFDNRKLVVSSNQFDSSRKEISIDAGGGAMVEVTKQISGGALGGALSFRSELLDSAQNQLGRLAMGVASAMNGQNGLGQDLMGNLGTDIFSVASLQVAPGSGVPNTVTANLDDADGLSGSDYMLRYDGANNYTLTRLSDNQTTSINTGGASPYTTASIDGFTLDISTGATTGDQFLVQPTYTGARDIQSLLNDPRTIAAAQPMVGSTPAANTGTASMAQITATDVSALPLATDVTLTYNAGTNEFSVAGASPAAGPFSYTSGSAISFNGLDITLSGAPADGDQFVISNNIGGVGDNRNALAMAAMQAQNRLGNGTATFEETYAQLVADVGVKTQQAVVAETAQGNLLQQSLNAQQSYSGVNLDEEAANLMKYQQAYQASAQVINAANTIFDALLNAVRR